MAEGLEPEAAGEPEKPIEAGSIGIGIALDGARSDPGLRDNIASFLARQEELIADQRHHLKVQLKHLGLKYFSERLRVGLQILVALGASALLLFVGGLVWQAATDKGLVVEAFSVPPDMAAQGITGEVVASQLEDKLSALQAATDSARAQASYSNDWGHEIKVEIPETGVSISELQRYLRQWLGHETRVGGEVFRTPEGLRLTVRAGGEAGDTASGPPTDLDGLLQRGAEALFARTQPYRYGAFLMQNGRQAEAHTVFAKLASDGSVAERPWALLGLALLEDDPHRAITYYRESLSVNPNLALTTFDYASAEGSLGHSGRSHELGLRTGALLERGDKGSMSARAAPTSLATIQGQLADDVGDYRAALTHIGEALTLPSYYGSREKAASWRAQDLALDHDVEGARAAMTSTANDADVNRALMKWGGGYAPHLAVDVDIDDWAAAFGELQGLEPMLHLAAATIGGKGADYAIRTALQPREAEAMAHLGRIAEAQALVGATPADCYDCVRIRGIVAAMAGRPAEADRWFAEAVRQAPALPSAYLSWAQARLARGDADGAVEQLRVARDKGPHFADALELWGEALMRKGDFMAATAKFREADTYAPHWGRNHLRWGQALIRLGDTADARAQFRMAANLALSSADRTELARLQAHG